jgi:hypothetical protein
MPPALFCFSYFLARSSHFLPRAILKQRISQTDTTKFAPSYGFQRAPFKRCGCVKWNTDITFRSNLLSFLFSSGIKERQPDLLAIPELNYPYCPSPIKFQNFLNVGGEGHWTRS